MSPRSPGGHDPATLEPGECSGSGAAWLAGVESEGERQYGDRGVLGEGHLELSARVTWFTHKSDGPSTTFPLRPARGGQTHIGWLRRNSGAASLSSRYAG